MYLESIFRDWLNLCSLGREKVFRSRRRSKSALSAVCNSKERSLSDTHELMERLGARFCTFCKEKEAMIWLSDDQPYNLLVEYRALCRECLDERVKENQRDAWARADAFKGNGD